MTDQEINEAVAWKLGWTEAKLTLLNDLGHRYGHKFITPMDPDENQCDCPNTWTHGIADYCHSIEAAWEIVEHLRSRYTVGIFFGCKQPQFTDQIGTNIEAVSDTAPMAICLAFLKLDKGSLIS